MYDIRNNELILLYSIKMIKRFQKKTIENNLNHTMKCSLIFYIVFLKQIIHDYVDVALSFCQLLCLMDIERTFERMVYSLISFILIALHRLLQSGDTPRHEGKSKVLHSDCNLFLSCLCYDCIIVNFNWYLVPPALSSLGPIFFCHKNFLAPLSILIGGVYSHTSVEVSETKMIQQKML